MYISTLWKHIKKHFPLYSLIGYSVGIFFVALRINIFRYNNFDYGKFDLGNMTQMVWNTLNGRFMMLTDLFGTNLPRWSMSHVDPILLLFVPVFALFQSPLTLVISQLILIVFSSVLIYKIAELELESKWAALFMGIAFLAYPATGFVIAWTGFHGVSAAIPFFLGAFYVFELMYKQKSFTRKKLALFWILSAISMSGKEEISLFFLVFGIFIALFRSKVKLGALVSVVGLGWFVITFFVIIPRNSHYRIEGFERFSESLDLQNVETTDVVSDNFFLSRYEDFGDSYSEIALNMMKNPDEVVRVIFSGDRPENFEMTFAPLLYTPLLYLPIFVIAIPELLINYSTTAGGIGTSEIYNHRISLIIPVLFIASIYAISLFSRLIPFRKVFKKCAILLLTASLLVSNVNTSFKYQNPIYLWLSQAIQKRVPQAFSSIAFAKVDENLAKMDELKLGERIKVNPIEIKDRECAQRIVDSIPDEASVSGPDYLGAHLSMRETYAIFPARFSSADYVIVDVFAQKILRTLGVDISLIRNVVGDLVTIEEYTLTYACGNLYVFERFPHVEESKLLPLQHVFSYDEKYSFEILNSLTIVDYTLPEEITRGELTESTFVYVKRESDDLNDNILFMTFVHEKTGDIHQFAHLPSFGLKTLRDWKEDRYYIENVGIVLPDTLEAGEYKIFVGMTNRVKTRSVYLGNVNVL